MFVLALGVHICAMPAGAIPYSPVRAEAAFTVAPTHGSRFYPHLTAEHDDIATSCIVKPGGRKQITGVLANGRRNRVPQPCPSTG